MSNSLDYRKDHRTREQLSANVEFGTARENRLMEEWALANNVRYKDYAPGRDGKFLDKSSSKADFFVVVKDHPAINKGRYPMEVKYTPCLWKATFKVADLIAYKNAGARILLVFGAGENNPLRWTIVTPDQIKWILQCISPKSSHPGMGGKPAVLVHENVYGVYFGEIYEWPGVPTPGVE